MIPHDVQRNGRHAPGFHGGTLAPHELPHGGLSVARRQYAIIYKYPLLRQEDNALPGYRRTKSAEDYRKRELCRQKVRQMRVTEGIALLILCPKAGSAVCSGNARH